MYDDFDNKQLYFGVILADGTIEELQPLGEIQEIAVEPLEPNVEEEIAALSDKAGVHTFTMKPSPTFQKIFLKIATT